MQGHTRTGYNTPPAQWRIDMTHDTPAPAPAPCIWVDADACPRAVKEVLFRAAQRLQVRVLLVANQLLPTPPGGWVKAIQVPQGFDVADNHIVTHLGPGDLVITADIPLAAEVLAKGGEAINPRGEHYSRDTIRQRLSMRNMMEEIRASGIQTGGPPPFGARDVQAFANSLDRWLARRR